MDELATGPVFNSIQRVANLSQANLVDADLSSAVLSYAALAGAYMIHARLGDAKMTGTVLLGTLLYNADLSCVSDLTQSQLDQACGTDAKLPPGLALKPCPPE
jgi:uncharacterized protein YjbI with pentapeptide repeats